MTEDIYGIAALAVVGLIVAYCGRRWPEIQKALALAFALRLVLVLFHYYLAPLPDSTRDSVTFDRLAWSWAQQPVVMEDKGDYLISWVLSFLYRMFGHHQLMAQSVSLLLGMGTVVAGWYLARDLWGRIAAIDSAWVLALFPILLLYSALILRESYVWFFFLLGVIGMVRWLQRKHVMFLLLAIVGFTLSTLFHGGTGIGAMVFLGLLAWNLMRSQVIAGGAMYMRLIALGLMVLALMPIAAFIGGYLSLPKIGSISNVVNVQYILDRMAWFTQCGSGYPAWVVPAGPFELIWKAPIIIAYFLFSPFPWDVDAVPHIVGLVDGVLYMGLIALLWYNRQAVMANRAAIWSLLVISGVVVTYSVGVGNFGTAIRHRSMIVPVLIALAAPGFSSVRMFFQNIIGKRRAGGPA